MQVCVYAYTNAHAHAHMCTCMRACVRAYWVPAVVPMHSPSCAQIPHMKVESTHPVVVGANTGEKTGAKTGGAKTGAGLNTCCNVSVSACAHRQASGRRVADVCADMPARRCRASRQPGCVCVNVCACGHMRIQAEVCMRAGVHVRVCAPEAQSSGGGSPLGRRLAV